MGDNFGRYEITNNERELRDICCIPKISECIFMKITLRLYQAIQATSED